MKTLSQLKNLTPEFLQAAQVTYDEWDQNEEGFDEELGYGGICQDIASAIASVCNQNGFDVAIISQEIDEQHVYTVAKVREGVISIDISPYIYEKGSGCTWKKRPDVIFTSEDIEYYRISPNSEDFDDLIEY